MRRRLLIVSVHGTSMTPVYQHGDTLLAVRPRRSCTWRVGEDVIFHRTSQAVVPPGDPAYLVKRIYAVAGDPVPAEVDGFVADPAHQGSVPAGWLLLQGLNRSRLPAYFYSVPVGLVVARIVGRLRRGRPAQGASESSTT